jgi:hypothetical protein
MLAVSRRTLRTLAAVVWTVGGVVLLVKGSSLLIQAHPLSPAVPWHWLGLPAALLLGTAQAMALFRKNCRKNLDRIATLERPRIWQFFRPGFFLALTAMILTGATLSRLAHGNYALSVGVGVLDLTLAVSLLASSPVAWRGGEP